MRFLKAFSLTVALVWAVVIGCNTAETDLSAAPAEAQAREVWTPGPADEVLLYDSRKGEWNDAVFDDQLETGDEVLFQGHLYRLVISGKLQHRGDAFLPALALADETWNEDASHRMPGRGDWVLVLGEHDQAGHLKLEHVFSGDRIAFQGRIYETKRFGPDGVQQLRRTDDVLARVTNTYQRQAPEVIDATIEFEDGTQDVLTGTPNHPFWVPGVEDFVALEDLEFGTALHTQDGTEAILISKTWRQGEFTVYDIEVEDAHNFYVRGAGSDGPGVLVHNSTTKALTGRADDLSGALDPIAAKQRTSAVLSTDKGNILGGGGRDLNPAQRAMKGPGETLAKSPGDHAEVTVLKQAKADGANPQALGTSRDICSDCKGAIEEAGGTVTGPRTAEW